MKPGCYFQAIVKINGKATHVHSQVFTTKEEAVKELEKNEAYRIIGFRDCIWYDSYVLHNNSAAPDADAEGK